MKNSLWVMLAAAGRPQMLKRTLQSIADCEKPASYVGTLVIENGPRCGVEHIVRSFPARHGFRHLYSEAPNKSQALNLGLKHTDDGWVVFTDDDVRVRRDWLMAYATAIGPSSGGRFFGGPVDIDAEHGLPPRWMWRYYPATLAVPWELPHAGGPIALSGQAFMGTNWAARATEIIEAGGFDPNMGPGADQSVGEETEAQRRLESGGSTPVYVPGAVVWHYLHREYLDPRWLLKRTYRHGLAWGINQTRGGQPWLRPVVAAWWRRLNANLTSALLRMAGGEKRRFQADYLAVRSKGRWDGIWIGRDWPAIGGQNGPLPSQRRAA